MSDKKSYWISSGKLSLMERVFMLIFGLLTFYLLVRTVDKSTYGAWMLFLTTTTLLDTARNGFLKNPLMRFINTVKDEDKSSLQASSFVMNVIFSVVTSLLLVLAAEFLEDAWGIPQLQKMFVVYVFTAMFMAIFFHCEYVQRAHFRFMGPMLGYALRSGLFCLVVIYFYFSDNKVDLFYLSIYYSAATFIATIVMWWFCRDLLGYKVRYKNLWASKLFGYGKYTFGTNVSAVLMRNVDSWMLGWLITTEAVATYNVAIRIANLFEVPLMALASIMFPQATKKAEEEGETVVKELYEKSVALIMLITIPFVVVVLLFSDFIVELVAGNDYAGSATVLNITMLYGLIIPFNKQMGILLDAVGKAKINMFFTMTLAILNVVLNSILIPTIGLLGAAYATFATMIVALFISQTYLIKNYGVTWSSLIHYMKYYTIEIYNRFIKRQTT